MDFAAVIQFKRKTEPMGTSNSRIVSLAGAATSIIFVTSVVATKVCLPRQNIFVATKLFVATKTCLSRKK